MTFQQDQDIQKAVQILKSGGVVGLPTETVYGLAANAFDEKAIKKIFETKKRPFFDPLIVHISHLVQMKSVVKEFTDLPQFLAEKFWPGPLTMVLPKSLKISSTITSGLDSVGVRFPKHTMAQKIISSLGAPVAAPSANLFGKTSPTTAEHVRKEFGETVFVADGGSCTVGLESTVVGFDENYQIVKIYRPGAITQEQIQKVLENFNRKVYVTQEESKVAPGHLKHHYMPNIPLVILEGVDFDAHKICEALKILPSEGAKLDLHTDATHAARELYANLRKCAELNKGFIYVLKTQDQSGELWTAIWDRLSKAATLKLGEIK